MSEAVIVACLSLIGTLIGSFAGIATSNKMVEFRLKKLEDKQDKHNQLIERTYKLEGQMIEVQHDISDLKNVVIGGK